MGAWIRAISYYLPEETLTNETLAEAFPEWDVDKVYNKVGVRTRHLAGKTETAGDLAEKAARKLFEEYGIAPGEVDFLLLCTQSPDHFLPSTACILQDRLGIPTSAGALDYDLGCSGCIYGLAMAKGLIAAGLASNVLLLTAETYTKYLHPEDKSNKTIFGDGAAACLVSREKGLAEIGDFVLGTDGSGAANLMVRSGAARQPEETVPPLMKSLLAKSGLEKADVDYFVFHQANKYMLSTLRKVCGIPADKFYVDLEETGNTVSSTILIGLKECLETGRIVPCCSFKDGLYAGEIRRAARRIESLWL